MIQKAITVLMLIVAVIHILPISGFLGVARLEALYGVSITGNEMEILMRHRAVLFGILGVIFTYAAFQPALQPLAFMAAFATLASFFFLAYSVGGYNDAIGRIVVADIVAILCLAAAVVLYFVGGRVE